ncbi:MAG: DUF2950 domain-containing protein [Acidobacteria bacterium]|nr:DUF2950 domain-containing protein [Acidobacteriota bacterium]
MPTSNQFSSQPRSAGCAAAVCASIIVSFLAAPAVFSQQGNERTFASPGEAVLALYQAAKAGDKGTLTAILGSNSGQILFTGDAVADQKSLADFVKRYDQVHRLVVEPDQNVTLYLGSENWPLPIPLVKNDKGVWYFNTETGVKEILYRRIGANENDAIEVMLSLVEAQLEYASTIHTGEKAKQYAKQFLSDAGKQNGLYWKTSDNEPPSPIGPMIAEAAGQGYNLKQGQATPFHGYCFRILTKQGPAAKGGAKDYVVNGQLTGGFAFVAYPAEYRSSGVMTFIVNQNGIVYEKDLGPDTVKIAAGMTEYNPDTTWNQSE